MAMRGPRLAVGSKDWIGEERNAALQIARSEVEEFSFSASNDLEWLNEHMASIFDENEVNVAEVFKTPGKLRGRTPMTARKFHTLEKRVPLSDIFSGVPKNNANNFTKQLVRLQSPRTIAPPQPLSPTKHVSPVRVVPPPSARPPTEQPPAGFPMDSGYHGSMSDEWVDTVPNSQELDSGPAAYPEIRYPTLSDAVAADDGTESDDDGEDIIVHQPDSSPQPKLPASFESTYATASEGQEPLQEPEREPVHHLPHTPGGSPRKYLTVDHNGSATESAETSPTPLPIRSSPKLSSPMIQLSPRPPQQTEQTEVQMAQEEAVKDAEDAAPPTPPPRRDVDDDDDDDDNDDDKDSQPEDIGSYSEASSPIRPAVMRKSSLNFASLPAREPMTTTKSMCDRLSKTSQFDQPRTSHHSRSTSGKSLGNANDGMDDMNLDEDDDVASPTPAAPVAAAGKLREAEAAATLDYNRAYTQRLQDQISLLGQAKTNPGRSSKSIPDLTAAPTIPAPQPESSEVAKPPSPWRMLDLPRTPGAFPVDDDDEDDWIASPTVTKPVTPRPVPAKGHTAYIMEGVVSAETITGDEFAESKSRYQNKRESPQKAPAIAETSTGMLEKSVSAPIEEPNVPTDSSSPIQAKPAGLVTTQVLGDDVPSTACPRTVRDSPLKQVKNKLSSILKSSKGLLASSAALSAESKTSLLSPSKLDLHAGSSTESLTSQHTTAVPMYPDLSSQLNAGVGSPSRIASSPRPVQKTRASAEREKEEKRKEKEAKNLAGQMEKLEKAREKEREKVRAFTQEQEKATAEKRQAILRTEHTAASSLKEPSLIFKTSPRKIRPQDDDIDELAAPTPAPLSSHARTLATASTLPMAPAESENNSDDGDDDDVAMEDVLPPTTASNIARAPSLSSQPLKPREIKRPMKPSKDWSSKTKQAPPTVIRVNTSSQHSQFHPSNSTLAANLHETLAPASVQATPQVKRLSKAPQTLTKKPSAQSLKGSVSSATGRPKALELAARKKEQDEREAQRKMEMKREMERKRAALQDEERRLELERRQEADRQKHREREEAEAKKLAQRQAALEKAKQTRAPPPVARSHPNGPPEYSLGSAPNGQREITRPPSRMNPLHRTQEEHGRPVNAILSKSAHKRTMTHDGDLNSQSRSGPTYQGKDAKRRRTSDDFDGDEPMETLPKIKGPPVRPSGGLKKDLPTKNMFGNNYNTAPLPRDLFKTTITAQHSAQIKAINPLDMAQLSKGVIPFAANPNSSTYKTPARPGPVAAVKSAMKSAARPSPKFPNGDAIELPEIQTDDDDDDDNSRQMAVASWADSPDLRRALMQQETVDPHQIFGPPAPLIMEEVFNKSKDRWNKFRARTSSANWSGADKLTEEEIRRDMQARDKMRRDGGWTYELGRDLM